MIPVARSFPSAPRKKASLGVLLEPRLLSTIVFNCSNAVYWIIGLMTRISPGITPLQSAPSPSVRIISRRMERNPLFPGTGFFTPFPFDSTFSSTSSRIVSRVFTTQIGFVRSTVALPAINPATILSAVFKGRLLPVVFQV